MPPISKQKKDKIAEQIIHYLFSVSPDLKFTAEIARNVARDEEFTKFILNDLKSKNLLVEVNKNPSGLKYVKRQRWRLSSEVFKVYKKQQDLFPK
ncbi:MAG: hypothetical protein AABY05_02980 [Nanoarchaeota archaeon]